LKESECLPTLRDAEEATDLLMDFWDVFPRDGSYGKSAVQALQDALPDKRIFHANKETILPHE
jgi:hypothetical protein